MKRNSNSRTHLEGMGLRAEDGGALERLNAVLCLAALLSGVAWIWLAVDGSPVTLAELVASRGGRAAAGLVGIATVIAAIRAMRRRAHL